MKRTVAIVGGGFSGALLAINLLRHGGPRAVLVERAGMPGKGLAYGAAHPTHVVNARASNMSAYPDDPGHFARWLMTRGFGIGSDGFARRLTYGDYLSEQLSAARTAAPERLEVVEGEAIDATSDGVRLTDGRHIAADIVVLAIGNLPPHTPPGIDPAALGAAYVGDPWDPMLFDGIADEDTLLILGSGLTMSDVALAFEARNLFPRIVALSRRGLVPRAHVTEREPWTPITERPRETGSALVRRVRSRGREVGWRNAVQELRRFTQDMWRVASAEDRARFLRHLRPWWDVHRHRLAPEVAARVEALRTRGLLHVVAGKLIDSERTDRGALVHYRRRGGEEVETLEVARIVNAIGPLGDLNRTHDRLLATLGDRGAIRADAARIGIDVDATGATVGSDGRPSSWLHAVGPMTRGAFWEIVAVSDIRVQAWHLARRLSNAHWVGGEGL